MIRKHRKSHLARIPLRGIENLFSHLFPERGIWFPILERMIDLEDYTRGQGSSDHIESFQINSLGLNLKRIEEFFTEVP
jgi:hypothetical protein